MPNRLTQTRLRREIEWEGIRELGLSSTDRARLDHKEGVVLSIRIVHLCHHHHLLVLPCLEVGRSKVAGHMHPGPSTVLAVSQIIPCVLSVVGLIRVSVGVRRGVVFGVVTWITELEIVHRMDKGVVTIALRPKLTVSALVSVTRPAPAQGTSSSNTGGQRQNRFYTLSSRQK